MKIKWRNATAVSLTYMPDSKKESENELRLTGASEACARSVFMFVCCNDAERENSGQTSTINNLD